MKTMRFLSMAALALVAAVMTSCSSEDNLANSPQQPENKSNVLTLTTTVGLDGGTRALSPTGGKTFAENETLALLYKNTSGKTVKAVSAPLTTEDIAEGAKSATFTFTLVDPDKSEDVSYVYPAAMANKDGSLNNAALYTEQDGTLSTLASKFDFCWGIESWAGENLPSATLRNNLAILALTLKDRDYETNTTTDVTSTITSVTICDGSNSYSVSRTAAEGPIYIAIYPTVSADIKINAFNGSGSYTKSLTDKTYEASNFYNQGLLMRKGDIIDLATLDDEYTALDGDILTGNLSEHPIYIGQGATVTLDNVTISGNKNIPEGELSGITCLGDATIILKDGTTNTVKGFETNYPGIYVPKGKTLTIQGNGTLHASCFDNGYAAGIGGIHKMGNACGNIKILGGNIVARGGRFSAGIGGCSETSCGNIIIYGGTINATGGEWGVGIGGGEEGGSCGNITIYGGNVTASAGNNCTDCAGIGSGVKGSCGNITISGGIVNATGGYDTEALTSGAGIGSGDHGSCGDITITTGVTRVSAHSSYLFGCIGSGSNGTCGTVTIGDLVTGPIKQGNYTYEPGN